MKKINVLFLMPQMGMGGSERLVHTLSSQLDAGKFNPSVAWLYGGAALPEFRNLGVPLHYLPKRNRVDFALIRQIARLIKDNDIHVVNAQHFMPAVYAFPACRLLTRTPLIFTAHAKWEVEDTDLKWRIAGGCLLRRMDAVVGVAPEVSKAVESVFGTSKSRTISIENGVDLERFSMPSLATKLRQQLGYDEKAVVFGIVANLKTVKNHLFLLKAFKEAASSSNAVRLLVVGRGFEGEKDNTEPALREFISGNGLEDRVQVLGYRSDIPELLRAIDVFCLVSKQEGLPIGLIEAMATERPVIGTDVEGIRDVISHQNDGLLVGLDDVDSLKQAMLTMAASPERRKMLGQSGRQKAVARYSLARCIQRYEALFQAVAKNGTSH